MEYVALAIDLGSTPGEIVKTFCQRHKMCVTSELYSALCAI